MRRWLLIAALLLLGGEAMTRLAEATLLPHPVGVLTDLVTLKSDHWTLRPGAAITPVERSGNVSYVINAEGYRGPLPKGPKTGKRIVVLGDSVTFGLGVEDSQTYPRVLETRLRAAGVPVEVANLAIFAYGPHEYLSTWRRVGRALAPDLVVLQLYMNDFGAKPWDQPAPVGMGVIVNNLTLRLIQASALTRRTYQAAHMAFFYWVRPLRRSLYPQSLTDTEPRDIQALLRRSKSFEDIEGIAQVHTLLREIKASGARVLLLYSPHETQLYKPDFDDIDAAVEKAFASEADAYVGLLTTLRAAPDRARIFRDGLHFDIAGHALVADTILKPIERALR